MKLTYEVILSRELTLLVEAVVHVKYNLESTVKGRLNTQYVLG